MGETPKPPTFYIYLLYNMALPPQCKYDMYDGKCYRKNPQHIKEYSHPEQTMLNLIKWKNSDNEFDNISTNTIEWKDGGAKREIYKAWLKWVTEKTLNKQFDEDEKKEVFGILMNLEEEATGGEFKADGKFKELLEAQGEHFKNDNGKFVFSNWRLFPYLKPSDEPELPSSKRRRLNPPTPKGGKKTRKPKKKTRKSKKRTRKSKTKRRKNI